MSLIDYKTIELNQGEFDIVLPLTKITTKSDLLFQQVNLLLETFSNDFPYDITLGMPYDDILEKSFDLTRLEGIYYDKIKVLVYFKDFKDFLIDIDSNRSYIISFKVVSENDDSKIFNTGIGV